MTGPGDALVDLVHAIDRLDWPGVRAVLAERLTTDYGSLFGGGPEQVTADELVARWTALLPGFDATQHLLGPVRERPDGEHAEVAAHVRAWHRIGTSPHPGAREWVIAGHYTATAERSGPRWRLTALRLDTFFQDGDPGLPAVATARAAAGLGRPPRSA